MSDTESPDDPSWYKHRPYPHFDRPLSPASAIDIVSDRQLVEENSFHPFIKRIDREERYEVYVGPTGREKGRVSSKTRRICYAAHVDAHIYAYYSDLLSKQYEAHIASLDHNESVVAYRKFEDPQCNIHFARDIFRFIHKRCEPSRPLAAMAFDVKGFFDNLDHGILKKRWASVMDDASLDERGRLPRDHYQLYKSLTKFAYVKERRLRQIFPKFYEQSRKERAYNRICTPEDFRVKVRGGGHVIVNPHSYGIPQGTPISALLSNIYMQPFDAAVHEEVEAVGGIYRRYSDDLLVVVPMDQESTIREFVLSEIQKLKLEIQDKKTESFRFAHEDGGITCLNLDQPESDRPEDHQLQYLGFVYDGRRVLIRPSSLTSFYRRMNGGVKVAANRAVQNPIDEDDPILRRSLLYERFSHKGKRNFVQYAYRAADLMKEVTGEDSIRSQVRNHWGRLHELIEKWETRVLEWRNGEREYWDEAGMSRR